MSYLIPELTNWWPLLSFRLDRSLGEGNGRTEDVRVCVERSQDDVWWELTKPPVTPMQSFLIRLYCTCFLYITVLASQGENFSTAFEKIGPKTVYLFVRAPHSEAEHLFCFVLLELQLKSKEGSQHDDKRVFGDFW